MGENFLKRQARNFKKGRDLAATEAAEPTLFSRPDSSITMYTANPGAGFQFTVGESLYVIAAGDGKSAVLMRGHQSVGRIDGDGAKSLLQVLKNSGNGGITRLKATDVSGVSGAGKFVVLKDT